MNKPRIVFRSARRLACLFLVLALTALCGRGVTSVPVSQNQNTVYVAGNPQLAPVEWYNAETGQYEGLFPALLSLLTEKTGLEFTYVDASQEDLRQELAENQQVELISGYLAVPGGSAPQGLRLTQPVLQLQQPEGVYDVCFAFTEGAGDELCRQISAALAGLSSQELATLTLASVQMSQSGSQGVGLAIVLLVLALASILVVWFYIRSIRRRSLDQELTDPATGLGNERYFITKYPQLITDETRVLYVIAYVQLDTDVSLHSYDAQERGSVLQYCANVLMSDKQSSDLLAHVKEGEFAIARMCSSEQEAGVWIAGLLDRLSSYSQFYSKEFRLRPYCGLYFLSGDDRNAETALLNARLGCRYAQRHKLRYVISNHAILAEAAEERQLQRQSLSAIENQEFQLYLQPIVDVNTGRIVGAEALARWHHPTKGLLPPDRFLALLEQNGAIGELDYLIFEKACQQLASWEQRGWTGLKISANFSRISFSQQELPQRIEQIAARYAFQRQSLIIELTEDAITEKRRLIQQNLQALKKMGFSLALDDMGSGYTSFFDLQDFPVDIVKIDRDILNGAVNAKGLAVLSCLVDLGHRMQAQVLCEGAETVQQVQLLQSIQCDLIQGYYYYRPMPAAETDRILQQLQETGVSP